METPIIIKSKAGVKRDGTQFEGDNYVDSQWCRFDRGLPRKIGGYRQLTHSLNGPPRELDAISSGGYTFIHSGWSDGLERFTVDSAYNAGPIFNRTPTGFTADDNNDWSFAEVYDTASDKLQIIAWAGPILGDVDSSTNRPIYYGDAYDTAALAAVADSPTSDVSGGVAALQSYAIRYGSNGLIGWSVSNKPSDFSGAGAGSARVTGQKIVKVLPLRGGGQSPAGLVWSLDSLLRMYFVGGGPIWSFDTLSSQLSILGPNTIIEFDGVYYWMGVDRFLMFNGVLQELDNNLNLNYVFDNLNFAARGKAFSFKVPRWGEIWWCVPMFGATEPNYAIIYNVRETRRLGFPVWYDTELPADLRGAAQYAQTLRSPLMTSALPTTPGGTTYSLWQHETGVDRIQGTSSLAIPSWFETGDISMMTLQDKPSNQQINVHWIEPDFVQGGTLMSYVTGRSNARSPQVTSSGRSFPPVPLTPEQETVFFKEGRRELRFKFESNEVGGDYQMGQCLAQILPTDGRILS
jgi:hypothetical protein